MLHKNRAMSTDIDPLRCDFADDSAMQKKWKAFCRKIDTQTDDFNTVLKIIEAFLTESFTMAVKGEEFTQKWSAADGEWI